MSLMQREEFPHGPVILPDGRDLFLTEPVFDNLHVTALEPGGYFVVYTTMIDHGPVTEVQNSPFETAICTYGIGTPEQVREFVNERLEFAFDTDRIVLMRQTCADPLVYEPKLYDADYENVHAAFAFIGKPETEELDAVASDFQKALFGRVYFTVTVHVFDHATGDLDSNTGFMGDDPMFDARVAAQRARDWSQAGPEVAAEQFGF